MGSARIYVVQIREIIKMLLFALVGLAIILMLIYFFAPKEKDAEITELYVPGTYSAAIMVKEGPITVDVIVTNNEIVSVSLRNLTEAHETFYPLLRPAMAQISEDIINAQGTDVEIPDQFSVTGATLLTAVKQALTQASSE
jgi:uncharacterized protein with FMN-binding domain